MQIDSKMGLVNRIKSYYDTFASKSALKGPLSVTYYHYWVNKWSYGDVKCSKMPVIVTYGGLNGLLYSKLY